MGGAAKRMMHPYDNLDISFRDMFDMIDGIVSDEITCSEKFDGTNLVWRVDESGEPLFARRIGQTVEGAFTYDEFITSLKGHPAEHIFSAGARAIKELTFAHGSPTEFGDNTWVNCEILLRDNPQMIRYDHDAVVLHKLMKPEYDTKGKLYLSDVTDQYRRKWELFIMRSRLLGLKNWKIRGPQVTKVSHKDCSFAVDMAKRQLESCMLRENLSMDNTVRDFLYAATYNSLIHAAATSMTHSAMLADNVARGGKWKIRDIKSHYPKYSCEWIDKIALSKNRDKWISSALTPIKECWETFGARILSETESTMIVDSDAARQRLVDLVNWNKEKLDGEYRETHPKVRSGFYTHYQRFERLKVLPPVSEGLVFSFKHNTYKVTGAFPSLNRVTGAVRYEIGVMYNEKDSN